MCWCQQNISIFGKISTFTQSNSMWALLEFFSVFVRLKVIINENVSFTDYASGIQHPDCSKLTKKRKNKNDVTISWHDVITSFFDVVLFFLWSLVTGQNFVSISSLVLELWQLNKKYEVRKGQRKLRYTFSDVNLKHVWIFVLVQFITLPKKTKDRYC